MDENITSSKNKAESDQNFPVFSQILAREHEQIILCSDLQSGLKAVIAIHNTTLGPSLGGVRMWPYPTEAEAIRDVLRLSRGMTYKHAISGLNLGGGKAVIIGDPRKDKSEALFRAFGRYVDGLGGRYLTAEDVGVTVRDMEWIHSETKYVTGISKSLGGGGDPSPVTAFGVYMGMKACALKAYGNDSLEGKRIAVQGAGKVGSYLAEHLSKEGAVVYISDIFEEKANEVAELTGAEVVEPDEIYRLDANIFSPCALGGVINDDTIRQLKCDIVAGGANNILEDEEKHSRLLMDFGIVYAPDYAINAGGVINISSELEGYNSERAHQKTSRIYNTILNILNHAEENRTTTLVASNILAEERINNIGRIDSIYSSISHLSKRKGELYLRNRS